MHFHLRKILLVFLIDITVTLSTRFVHNTTYYHVANQFHQLTKHPTTNSNYSILSHPKQQVTVTQQLFKKICIGTSNRMSSQQNKSDHHQNLAERYRNCTYIIGNLEITWIKGPFDLTFLESIREITGYLLIAYVEVERIRMPNLQIIRGRDLFRLNNGQQEEFAMFLIENDIKSLELPNLREILAGSVYSYNNRNLCHIRTINWDEILNWPTYKSVFIYNGTEPECPPCDASCLGSCWGEGPEMCQKFSKINCSPQCSQGRCFGSLPRECCHLFCAGGCTGPKQTDCLACKNFYDDGECIQECPSMQRYDPSRYVWETNPNGKYAHGNTCVKECPEHLLRDNGACVRTCPPNKRSANGECVPCAGPCPKNCQGVEVVHSGNIDQLINCTVIEGSLTILDTSFTGYREASTNGTLGTRYEPMHPSRLDVFKTLREITGYLNIQANHTDFKDLSCFRNLKVIGGRQLTDTFHALSIIKTSLVTLNMHNLRKIRSGKITIEENPDLCFADTIDWSQLNITAREEITTRNNANPARCRQLGLQCHEQCAQDGCWGPGPDECLSCNNYKLDDYCVENCTSTQSVGFLSYNFGNRMCKKCHPECRVGCSSTEARHCYQCKNVKDGPYCVAECPIHKFNKLGSCQECDKSCSDGCTGSSNRLGEGGCNSCSKAVINSTQPNVIGYCIKADEPCPEGYYQEYIGPYSGEGLLKSSVGRPVCRRCHNRCKSCSGMGTHVSVCDCAKYVSGEQCEDYCSRDHYADDHLRECVRCSPECNGCFGPTDMDCIACRKYRIYNDTYSASGTPTASAQTQIKLTTTPQSGVESENTNNVLKQQMNFKCAAKCPSEKPHLITEDNMLDPYCSSTPVNSKNSSSYLFGGLALILLPLIYLCYYVHNWRVTRDQTVKMTWKLSGFDDDEPLNQSNMKPNLAPLRSIKVTELRIGKQLGAGIGGTVHCGAWFPNGQDGKSRPVAIKILHENQGQSNRNKEFLEEAYIMASVNHPNLVRLLGVCTTPNQLMLVTQLVPLGCLLDYVQKEKNKIGSKNLLEWCKQIAKGMAYLEEHRMVHRDLALRNVLLQHHGRALISDFGLAKFLEVDQSEYHSGGGRLPIKWLAPECIKERKFTHKSDVWAFGVTVWELLTFGAKPFDECETKEVPLAIEKGARLQQPSHVTAEVYKVMYSCWFYDPKDRPDFKSLADYFVNFARDPERYLPLGAKGIEYSTRRDINRNSDSDLDVAELEEYSDLPSFFGQPEQLFGEQNSQPRTTLPDLLTSPTTAPSTPAHRLNEAFKFELRHHSESSETTAQIGLSNGSSNNRVSTPSFKKLSMCRSDGGNMNGHLIDQTVSTFSSNNSNNGSSNINIPMKMTTTPAIANLCGFGSATDANNNNLAHFIPVGSRSNHMSRQAESIWSMNHTVSTNSLGQKSEQPVDRDDYLLPSPSTPNEVKFSKFLASHEAPTSMLTQTPSSFSTRDPPHSAGLIGISNDEYFIPRASYVNSNGSHHHHHHHLHPHHGGTQNASSGHIPHSLV